MDSYTIYIDGINGFYASVIGHKTGAHTDCYPSIEDLWAAIQNKTDKMLWPKEETNHKKSGHFAALRRSDGKYLRLRRIGFQTFAGVSWVSLEEADLWPQQSITRIAVDYPLCVVVTVKETREVIT